jgi:hypothetical protein
MLGGEGKTYPIQVLVNYWEIPTGTMGAYLEKLVRHSVHRIATFVPWQAFESDISHSLMKFLLAASEKKLEVSLILTPEIGVHFQNSGIPKDLLSKSEVSARGADGAEYTATLPPNLFALPSLFAEDFNKRYFGFLARMNSYLLDLDKSNPNIVRNLTLVITGSFWKYYRPAQMNSLKRYSLNLRGQI